MIQKLVDPDETKTLDELVQEVVEKPQEWLDHPNPALGGKKPRDLIGTSREPVLRNLLRSIKLGMFV